MYAVLELHVGFVAVKQQRSLCVVLLLISICKQNETVDKLPELQQIIVIAAEKSLLAIS